VPTPSQQYRRTAFRQPKELPGGIDARVDSLAGLVRRRRGVCRALLAEAEAIDELAPAWHDLSDRHLRERLEEFHSLFRRGRADRTKAVLPQALAALREAAERRLGLRPFRVQLMGTLALHRGLLAEMATGEGKTLTAAMAAVLAGWTRQPTHVVTANDYLAQRDAETMGPLFRFCNVSAGFVTGLMEPGARREAYDKDVTYTTSKEIVADFLRDRLHVGTLEEPERRHLLRRLNPAYAGLLDRAMVMRGLHTAIVDEADSVLIDEAVTPLIISREHENVPLTDAVRTANAIAAALVPGTDYLANRRYKEVELRPAGTAKIQAQCGLLPGLWQGESRREELVRQALTAREFFRRDEQYVLVNAEVLIVDEFTGRVMPGRKWREGLHQAVEAKEGLAPTAPTETLSRLSFQRFFRLFERLSGMTGTAREAADEFWRIYKLPVVPIPTNRPCVRQVRRVPMFRTQTERWDAVEALVVELHSRGVPVLVGTRSVLASERLAFRLEGRQLPFRLLNAVRNQEEAQIVAEAGLPGHITIATNMAGRGTDIKLGKGVPEAGGLHVIATEYHEAGRIDRQLYGRCARQGDPGTVHVFASSDDELLLRFLPATARRALTAALAAGRTGAQTLARAAVGHGQRAAQRLAFRQRCNLLRQDTWLDEALSFTGSSRYR